MVDFQSRETHRGVDDDEPATDEEAADEDAAETTDTPTDEDAADPIEEDVAPVEPDADTAVSVAILVTGAEANDAADAVAEAIDTEHDVLGRDERTGDLDAMQTAVNTFLDQSTVEAVVTVGGVGVGPAEVAVEAVEPLLDTNLPGFGELFRRHHEGEVGTRAIRNRAIAGMAETTPVFCLPGEPEAARAAANDLLVPELPGLVASAAKSQSNGE